MDDEPLEEWAARREQRRPVIGERRAAPLDNPDEHGSHVAPQAPRGIQEWDGHQWVPVGVAENLTAAAVESRDEAAARAERVPLPRFGNLPPRPKPWRPTEPFHRPDPPG